MIKYSIIILFNFVLIIMFSCSGRKNHLELAFSSDIDSSRIHIRMEVLGSVPVTQVYDGKKEFIIPNGYGENEWYLVYNNTLKAYFRQFKTNRNDVHKYRFHFYKNNNRYFADVDITGRSDLKRQIELKKD